MRHLFRRPYNAVLRFYYRSGIVDDVPALTYYFVFSLAPLALGLGAIATLVFAGHLTPAELSSSLNRFLPSNLHGDVKSLILQTRDNSPALLALAIVAMLWTLGGAVGVVERCMARLLGRGRHDNMLMGKLRHIGLGAVLILLIFIATYFATLSGGLRHLNILPASIVQTVLLTAATTLVLIIACGLLYRFAPLGGPALALSSCRRLTSGPGFPNCSPARLSVPVLLWVESREALEHSGSDLHEAERLMLLALARHGQMPHSPEEVVALVEDLPASEKIAAKDTERKPEEAD